MGNADLGAEGPDATPTVTVTSAAVVRAEPDEAVLRISLSSLQDHPGSALSDVSGRSQALITLLDGFQVDRAERSTTGVTVYEEIDHTPKGRKSLGHRAVSQMTVRLRDPDVIGRLIAQATESLAARIDGPRWVISPANPVRLEAARHAAAESRLKAEAYAEGVGAQLGQLIRLVEPDQHLAIRAAGGLQPMAREHMPIEAGEHEVTAVVQATFALIVR